MPRQDWDGEDMLAAFVDAGGVFENARLGEGANGRGVFVVDPAVPVRINVPAALLVERRHLLLEDGTVHLAPESPLTEPARRFVARYYEDFCWGPAIERDIADFLSGVATLAPEIRALLSRNLGFGPWLQHLAAATPFERFKLTRSMAVGGRPVMMPVADLVNHAPDAKAFTGTDGVEIAGRFDHEITARYHRHDTLVLFQGWGFAGREQRVYSLPMLVPWGGVAVGIVRSFPKAAPGQPGAAPSVTREGNLVSLSKLLLADRRAPERPLAQFARAMEGIEGIDVPTLFGHICDLNRTALERALAALAPYSGAVETELRQACFYQLEALPAVATPPGE